MRIGISAESVAVKGCGMQTYILNLLRGLTERDGEALSGHRFIAYVSSSKALDYVNWTEYVRPRMVRPYSNWVRVPFSLPMELAMHPVDLLHVQNVAPPVCSCPFVVTVHDTSYEFLPETFTPLMRLRLAALIPRTARRAVTVITSSYNSRDDIVRLYHIDPEKITVVYPSLSTGLGPVEREEDLAAVRAKYTRGERYILYLGVLEPKKNVDKLIRAYASLRSESDLPYRLAIAGPKAWLYQPIVSLIDELGLQDNVLLLGYVPDADLPALYSAAEAFCFLSAYEGFGFPPAEAMSCGTPLVVSRGGSLPEVTGEAGLVVDPGNVGEVARAIARVVGDAELRRSLRSKGLAQAAKFTTENYISRVLTVYHEAGETLARRRRAVRA